MKPITTFASLVVVWIIGALSPALYDPEVVIDVQVQVFNLIPVIALTLFLFIHPAATYFWCVTICTLGTLLAGYWYSGSTVGGRSAIGAGFTPFMALAVVLVGVAVFGVAKMVRRSKGGTEVTSARNS